MDRVLEIGGFAAGFCGRLFVQNGCEVLRARTPRPASWVGDASIDMFLHAGKQSLGDVRGAELREIAESIDVVVLECAVADEADVLGIDDWNVDVKVVITPFGRSGPKRNWRATPSVILAMAGYTYLMGDPGRAPLSLPGHYVEFQTGQFAYVAANACRIAGDANTIDIGMLESIMALSQFTTVQWHCANRIRSRHGSDFWYVVPTNLFRCRDGWCYLNIVPTFWDAFTIFLDRPELAVDERFATNDDRMANREALHAIIQEVLAGFDKSEVRDRATAARIPMGLVQTFEEILADPHLEERDFWQTIEHEGERYRAPSLPFRFDNEPSQSLTHG